jgi:Undecaprenyl-phosphate glucose phosphotransferase
LVAGAQNPQHVNIPMNFVTRGVSAPAGTPADEPIRYRAVRKWLISYRSIESIAFAFDVVAIFFSSVLTGVIYHLDTIVAPGDILQYVGYGAAISALFLSLTIGRGLYDPGELLEVKSQIHSVVVIWIGVFLFYAGVVFALKIGADFSRGAVLLFAAVGLGILVILRMIWYLFLVRGLAGEKFLGRDAVLISEDPPGTAFVSTLVKHGFELKQQFILPAGDSASSDGEDTSPIISYLRESPNIEEVLVSGEIDHCSELIKRLSRLRELPIAISFMPVGMGAAILMRPSRRIGDAICIELQRKPLNLAEVTIKRVVDVVCAGVGLVALLPLLTITAIAIKLDSSGPVLFRQRRCGFNGSEFHILKFRTMSVLEDGQLVCQATRGDRRITRIGKWLRRTSIDELPQLLNVLSGSMSLVGPRPHALAHDNEFDKVVRNYAVRHHVKPGLTGWAQVNGCRGPTPTVSDIERRVAFDLWYIDNWNFRLDCLIIARTVIEVLRGRNAY